MRKTILSLLIITISAFIFSCSFNKEINQTNDFVTVLKAVKTPIVGGANKARGMRIGLKILKHKPLTNDSISYEGFTQPITKVSENGDTVWIESYYYPNQKMTIANDSSPVQYTSNSCTLHYHMGNSKSSLLIKNLELVSDQTKWE